MSKVNGEMHVRNNQKEWEKVRMNQRENPGNREELLGCGYY